MFMQPPHAQKTPPDVLEIPPKMCEDAARCAWEAPDVPEIVPDVPGIPPDLPEHPQLCLWPLPQRYQDTPRCARHPQMCPEQRWVGWGVRAAPRIEVGGQQVSLRDSVSPP